MADEVSSRPRLGRGLAALIGDVEEDASVDRSRTRRVAIEFLRPNPRNPRTHFGETELDELAASIRERGLIQPIVVRPIPRLPDAFEIIAGERRWRASQRAGLHDVPVVVLEADDKLALELAIVENVQRTDLNAIEEAIGYERLVSEHGYSQTDLAGVLGKSRSHVANTLRLLKLPGSVRDRVGKGELSAGHARALLAVDDPEAAALRVVEQGLTVRDVEEMGRRQATRGDEAATERPGRSASRVDADTRALMAALEDVLGLSVRIDDRGGAGEVRIRYRSLDQLDGLCRRLRGSHSG